MSTPTRSPQPSPRTISRDMALRLERFSGASPEQPKETSITPRGSPIVSRLQLNPDTSNVTVNVGGTLFETTQKTLNGSILFSEAFNSGGTEHIRKEKNMYTVDRTPQYFVPILHYLRTHELRMEKNISADGVLDEARFYRIERLVHQLEQKLGYVLIDDEILQPEITREEFVRVIMNQSIGSRMRFRGMSLVGLDLKRLDLTNTNFDYCQLQKATLKETELKNATFVSAKLTHARMKSANILGNSFQGAEMNSVDLTLTIVEKTQFDNADMKDVLLSHAKIVKSSFKETNMIEAQLQGVKCEDCDFSGSNMEGADLSNATFIRTKFKQVTFTNANFSETIFQDCDFSNCDITRAVTNCTNFVGSNFSTSAYDVASLKANRCNVTGCNFSNCVWKCALQGYDLRNCNFTSATLSCDLSDSNLENAIFRNCKFGGSVLLGARLSCDLTSADFKNSRFELAQLRNCILTNATFENEDLSNQDCSSMNLSDVKLVNANLTSCTFNNSNMQRCDLTGAILTSAVFFCCDLQDAKYTIEQLKTANTVHGAKFVRANWAHQDLRGLDLEKCDLSEADLSHCDLTNVNLTNAKLVATNLRHTTYKIEDIWRADFEKTRMHSNTVISSSFGGYTGELFTWVNNHGTNIIGDQKHSKIMCIKFKGDVGYTGMEDGTIAEWSLQSETLVNTYTNHGSIECMQLVGDTTLVCGRRNDIDIWDVQKRMKTSTIGAAHDKSIMCMEIGGQMMITGAYDGKIKLWDFNTLTSINEFAHERGSVKCMSYRPVDNVLVTAGYGEQILLWDTRTAQAQRKLNIPHKHITSVECLSLEGSTLIWNGAEDSVIRIWDLRNLSVPTLRRYSSKQLTRKSSFATIESPRNEVIGETQLIGHTQPVRTLSTKGNTIVSGGDDCCVILWDTQRSEMVEQLKGHTVPVRTVQVIE